VLAPRQSDGQPGQLTETTARNGGHDQLHRALRSGIREDHHRRPGPQAGLPQQEDGLADRLDARSQPERGRVQVPNDLVREGRIVPQQLLDDVQVRVSAVQLAQELQAVGLES
jgi:hypothetical protein